MRADSCSAAGQGITPHVDLAAFGDGIASVSLGAATVMDFVRAADGRSAAVLLQPGDLLMLHGEARYEWTHGCVSAALGAGGRSPCAVASVAAAAAPAEQQRTTSASPALVSHA
jgi:hypothetical protein